MIFEKIKNFFKRNIAFSDMHQAQMGQPLWTTWTLEKAVKEGYNGNVWVNIAVRMIAKNASSVPWYVSKDGAKLDNHHLTKLMERPNPSVSRQDFMELWFSWLELAGNAYGIKIKQGTKTIELWPASPDRLAPVPSKVMAEWLLGYAIDGLNAIKYQPDEVIHAMYFNPANPLLGISTLQGCCKVVDVDNAQDSFNASAMQNRCVVDGTWVFEREFISQDETNAIADKINEKHSGPLNARRQGVLGSNAKYIRTALNPIEMDFLNTGKVNGHKILAAFGIPPQLAGSQESSTYNNFAVASAILWGNKIIPILEDVKDALNASFYDELMPGEEITYDTSNISALLPAYSEKIFIAKELSAMGLPFEQINSMFNLGASEFEGWDKSTPKAQTTRLQTLTKSSQEKFQVRASSDDIEAAGEKFSKDFESFLDRQGAKVNQDLAAHNGTNIQTILKNDNEELTVLIFETYSKIAGLFVDSLVVSKRDLADTVTTQMLGDLLKIAGVESGLITQSTIDSVFEQITDGLTNGLSMAKLQQAIIDTGIFSPERSLRIARTVATGAANVGQLKGAQFTGATHKTWITGTHDVRDTHQKMDGVKIPIGDMFTVGGKKCSYPGDNSLPAKERVNCRCGMSFSIED